MKKKVTPKKAINRSQKSKKVQKSSAKLPKKEHRAPKKKYAVLRFDLEDEWEWQSFKNAMKADHMADKIECLYQEVFRPHLKYDQPLVNEYTGVEIKIDEMTADILRAIFYKCDEHFYPREE